MNCSAILLAAATAFNCFPPEIRTVGVVMPASIQPKARFDAGVEALKAAGFRIKLAKRLNFKTQACARGGSGSENILPLLDWNRLRTRDQRVLGFSNITMILNAMAKEKAGHPFSGSSISHLLYAKGDTFEWLKRAIAGSPQPPAKLRAIRPGAFSGLPCGGHIALVRLGIKTNWACDAAGRVVFLERNNSASAKKIAEELDEIAASGWLKDCAGVIFGDVTPGREGKGGKRTLSGAELAAAKEEVARAKRAFVEKIGKPAYDGFAYGHIPVSHAIDFRRKVSVAEDGTMTWE